MGYKLLEILTSRISLKANPGTPWSWVLLAESRIIGLSPRPLCA